MHRTILGLLLATLTSAGLASALDQPRHLEDAIRAQMRMTNARPNDSGVLNDLGNLLTLAGDAEQAEEVYRRALEISPDEAIIRYNLGLLLRLTGHSKAALRELKKSVELDSSDPWGHYQLGVLLEERSRNSKAVDHYAEAFLLQPELMDLEVNPQLLDSRLLTRAMTVAYTERLAGLESAPRQYEHPKRITRLLVPETKRRAAGEAEAEIPEGDRKRPKSRKKQKTDDPGDS